MSDPELERWRELTGVSDDEVAMLHHAVMARVVAEKTRVRRSYWWLAAAAAVLIAAVAIGWRATEPIEKLALQMPAAPVAPQVRFTPRPVVAKRHFPVTVAPEKRASVIKIFTDDPDVVILLVSDGGEE